ncbi:MAG: SGNH/GDSL hydrolase family protein [Ferruginibacter sp.]
MYPGYYFTRSVALAVLLQCCMPVFSQQDWAGIYKYRQANKIIKMEKKKKSMVVFMGDSITEGWIGADSNFFSDNHFINRGISGQTTGQMLARFRQDVLELNPEKVVILAGINDIAENMGPVRLEDIMDNIKSMTELAKAHNIKVILCSVLPADRFSWRPELKPAAKVVELNNMIKSYAVAHKLFYVDYHKPMANSNNGLPPVYATDGVHPTKTGYKVMEKIILPMLTRK